MAVCQPNKESNWKNNGTQNTTNRRIIMNRNKAINFIGRHYQALKSLHYSEDKNKKWSYITEGHIYRLTGVIINETHVPDEVYITRVHPVKDEHPDSITLQEFRQNFGFRKTHELQSI